MNKQAKYNAAGELVSLGIEWTHAPFGIGTGFTANPIRGCQHGCKWQMGDATVQCYAETQRDRMDGKGAFKNITYHPDVFTAIRNRRTPSGIFIDSMSDLCGEGVKSEWMQEVIDNMRTNPHHVFFVLTKNPRRLTEFEWPDNALIGISAPPTEMYGKEMNVAQQRTWFRKGFDWLMKCEAKHKWVSFEPLAVDLFDILAEYADFDGGDYPALDWAVIGAGSDGRKYFQPDESVFVKTLEVLDGCPIFYKGNLDRSLAERHGGWREEFPILGTSPAPFQGVLDAGISQTVPPESV